MNKEKSPRRKFSLITILVIASLVIGIGCIFWALINIGAESVASADFDSSPSFIQTASPTETAAPSAEASFMAPAAPTETPETVQDLYPVYPSEGDNIGSLSIPALKLKLPIYEGTNTEELKKGVGHFIQSVLPGVDDNCVLSGHRDTVFTKLGKLNIGDQFIVKTSAGTFTYEISNIRIVEGDDRTVIVPTDHAVLTVSTCYPFIYVGSAPDRYILTADLVQNN